jgi:hypothetical protein
LEKGDVGTKDPEEIFMTQLLVFCDTAHVVLNLDYGFEKRDDEFELFPEESDVCDLEVDEFFDFLDHTQAE